MLIVYPIYGASRPIFSGEPLQVDPALPAYRQSRIGKDTSEQVNFRPEQQSLRRHFDSLSDGLIDISLLADPGETGAYFKQP